MSKPLLLALGVALMLAGMGLMMSGVGFIGRKPGGERPPVDAARLGMGALLDMAGVLAIAAALFF